MKVMSGPGKMQHSAFNLKNCKKDHLKACNSRIQLFFGVSNKGDRRGPLITNNPVH